MRIVPAAVLPAKPLSVPPSGKSASPAAIICAALMLALVFLAFQIASALRVDSFSDCSSIGDSVSESCPI
ncbi:MAG TPA: hypothetical protein VFL62_09095 [Bradyrhizobium sp.]|uniref:hypothetical protein n=1 Tax=Bradyrhizobium sp. TaxID=376 RepID=UPI002D80E414|nr:hypothetical protein [Bradyrhizobium sp.]HET7886367.1 hypothetical protein [Bradyrhizobium sp.]